MSSAPALTHTGRTAPHTRQAVFAVLALAVGGFAIGTSEFVTMGVLPQIAAGLHVPQPKAATAISLYALGVVVGVPVLSVLGARLPRRALLVGLMAAYALCNLLSALATGYGLFTAARFLDGLPHGAYFGVATLVASGLVPPERHGRAVAGVLLGLSVANVAGVPAATWLGQNLGWRAAYTAAAAVSMMAAILIFACVPSVARNTQTTGRAEARAFFTRRQVWFTMAAGAIGFGGLFSIYSYIATTVTVVSGLPHDAVPLFLLAFGLGMTAGTWLGGELAAWSVFRSLVLSCVGSAVLMGVFWTVAPYGWWALPLLFLISAAGAVFVTTLQLRLMAVSADAVTLGAAMIQSALNIANALGAWLGGLVISAGLGYRAPALVGAAMSLAGAAILWRSSVTDRDAA